MKAKGKGIKPIMRALRLAKETVRRFYRAEGVEELLAKPRAGRPSILDEHKPYLHERWTAGVTNASTLYREITEQGYRGSMATVAAYVAPFRTLGAAPPGTPAVPKVRHITSWMLRRPDDLDADEQLQVKQVLAAYPHLDATPTHIGGFAEMLTGRHGERLDAWMAGVRPMTCPTCTGSSEDSSATTRQSLNGLTLPHSSGAVERQRQPHQNDQEADVRPSRIRPVTQTHPPRRRWRQQASSPAGRCCIMTLAAAR